MSMHGYRIGVYRKSLFWTVAVVASWFLLVGFYYEEGTDSYFKLLANGFYTDEPEHFYNLGILRYHSFIFKPLYIVVPAMEWYDVFTVLHVSFGVYIYFLLCGKLLEKVSIGPLASTLIYLFSISGLLEFLTFVQITRIAFLIAGGGYLFLYFSFSETKNKPVLKTGSFWLSWFAIGYAALLRIEPVILLSLFFVPAAWLFMGVKSFGPFLRIHIPVFLVLTLVSVSYRISITPEDVYYARIRPYTYTLWDFKRSSDNLRLNGNDSLVVQAVNSKFLMDTAQMNPAFFERIGLIPMDKSLGQIENYFTDIPYTLHKLWETRESILRDYGSYIPIAIALLVLVPLCIADARMRRQWILYQLWFLFFILGIAVFLKLEHRVIGPFFSINIFSIFVFLRVNESRGAKPDLKLFLLCCILFGATFVLHCKWFQKVKTESETIEAYAEYMERVYCPAYTVFAELGFSERMGYRLFGPKYHPENYFSITNAHVFMYASYRQKMKELTGAADFVGYMDYLATHSSLLLVPSRKMDMLLAYTNAVYGTRYRSIEFSPLMNKKETAILKIGIYEVCEE